MGADGRHSGCRRLGLYFWGLVVVDLCAGFDITTQGPSTSLALLRSGRDDRVGEVDKAPHKPKSGLNGPPAGL